MGDRPGRYSLNRAHSLELCNRCQIHYDVVHRPLAAPRSERELEAVYGRRMEPYGRIMKAAEPILASSKSSTAAA